MDTKQRILEAALVVYGQKGFRGATTRRIADLAGVNEVTIFRHFGSKQELFAEALRDQASGGPVAVLPAFPADPITELSAWTEAHLRALARRGQVLRASMGELEERPELANGAVTLQRVALTELRGYLQRLTSRGLARSTVDLHSAAAMLTATIFADATRNQADPAEPDVEKRARSYATVVLTAVGALAVPVQRQRVVRASAPPSLPDATGA
ncbi:hypothetical protein BH23GEM2_BH23GEM2_01470 [soil metagenome]